MDINISHDKIIINPLWQKGVSQANDEAYAYNIWIIFDGKTIQYKLVYALWN